MLQYRNRKDKIEDKEGEEEEYEVCLAWEQETAERVRKRQKCYSLLPNPIHFLFEGLLIK